MPSERSRRSVLVACGALVPALSAGCLDRAGTGAPGTGGSTPDGTTADAATPDPPLTGEFDCADASRPTPDVPAGVEVEYEAGDETRTAESVGSVDYPAPPDRSDDGAVAAYATTHEEAYVRNDLAADFGTDLFQFGLDAHGETVERRDGVATVRFSYVCNYTFKDDGKALAGTTGSIAAVYAVSDGGVARAVEGSPDDPSDLHPVADGSPVVCFE